MENYSRNFRSKYRPHARQEIPIGKCKVIPICWHYQTRLSVYRPIKANIYLANCKQISSNWLVGAHSESLSVFLSHAISMPIFFHAPRLAAPPAKLCSNKYNTLGRRRLSSPNWLIDYVSNSHANYTIPLTYLIKNFCHNWDFSSVVISPAFCAKKTLFRNSSEENWMLIAARWFVAMKYQWHIWLSMTLFFIFQYVSFEV